MVPKRFDARFFMADAERLISLERQADCGELDEIAWFELEEALALDLPTVTELRAEGDPAEAWPTPTARSLTGACAAASAA